VGNLALLRNPTVGLFNRRVLLFDFGGLIAIAGMSTMLIISTIRHTAALYQEEKIR
jgi:hypothetical protein